MTKRLFIVCLVSFFILCVVSSAYSKKDESAANSSKVDKSDDVLSGWTVVNDGNNDGPSAWSIADGIITQSSNLYGGDNAANNPEKPGTYALNGEKDWIDLTMSVDLRSRDDDAIGVMFRYQDISNYYRFSMDKQRNYRRLCKKVNGKVTVLAEDRFSYEINEWYKVKIVIIGLQIKVYMDDNLVFSVMDDSISHGQIGLYTWGNAGSDFRDLLMTLNSGWVIVDEGLFEGPSSWSVKDGVIRQSSNIRGRNDQKDDPDKPGTYVINGDSNWTDYELNVKLRSTDDDAIGIMFRYQDPKNYYRFSMDKERQYRRLIKKINGKITTLAEDSIAYIRKRWYKLTIKVYKNSIKIIIDNNVVFNIADTSISSGKICIYSWGNSGSEFKDLSVTALDEYEEASSQQYIEPVKNMDAPNFPKDWIVVDDGRYGRPSSWSMVKGVVLQTSNVYGGSDLAVSPVKPGTYLINGRAEWKDYIFSGKMRSLDDDAIGVMFRYQDDNNYYRLSIDKQRKYRRLIKKVDGYVITLAEEEWEYEINKWYSFKIILSGKNIKVNFNGNLVFDAIDSDISGGKIGRYCWGNEGSEFKKFKVLQITQKESEGKIADATYIDTEYLSKECYKLVTLEKQLESLQKEILKFRKECDCY